MVEVKKKTTFLFAAFFVNAAYFNVAMARAGGGGSSSGSSGSSSGSYSAGANTTSMDGIVVNPLGYIIPLMVLVVIGIIVSVAAARKRMKKIAQAKIDLRSAAIGDSLWEENTLENDVVDIFNNFQKDWSKLNAEPMPKYLSASFYERIVLEMNVLSNEHRKNFINNPRIHSVTITDVQDKTDNSKDRFTAQISASAEDRLVDVESNENLFTDSSNFTEYWSFVREDDVWKLDEIRQSTEDLNYFEAEIAEFAKKNNFFYNPDFGWLMMPNKGVIFKKTNFKTSDINNHVIGYFRDKIVEFYTYIPYPRNNSSAANYIVAQAVLPVKYHNILVRRKRMFFNFAPRGLRRIQTESNDFERKFCLWAHPQDQFTSFELLTPNFMEKVYHLPFELNIEIVGNFLYFYAKSRKGLDYDMMLEIMSWAFDEMER